MNQEKLKKDLEFFADNVCVYLKSYYKTLNDMPKYEIRFSDDLYETENWFDICEKVIYIG